MPHQCVRCNSFYEDGSERILTGCTCGAKLFFFIKKDSLKYREAVAKLSPEQREQVEKDAFEVLGVTEPTSPVVLDLESVNIYAPGKYELDLVRMFKGEPLIFKVEEGKYIIDIPETFERLRHT